MGAFLRRCRERRQPEAVGIKPTGRRRGPGLRREDVAALAGISTTWYTWIEQGRDVSVSNETLCQIADVLDLSRIEREYLASLARIPSSAMPTLDPTLIEIEFRPLLDALETTPAIVLDARFELLTANLAARRLFLARTIHPHEAPNLVWTMLVEPDIRERLVGWDDVAKHYVAELRKSWARYADDDRLIRFIRELSALSPEFSDWWETQDIATEPNDRIVFDHPRTGRLSFQQHAMQPNDRPGLTLMLFTPLPETDTAYRVRSLVGGSTPTE